MSSSTSLNTRQTKSAKAGLVLPVSRFQRNLKLGKYANRIGTGSAVYLTAAVEYLIAEVFELAGQASKDNKKKRIIPRHIMVAIKNDEELSRLFNDIIIPQGGVIPHIEEALLPKSSRTKRNSQGQE